MLRKCSSLAQIRRKQKMPGPLLLVYFMVATHGYVEFYDLTQLLKMTKEVASGLEIWMFST
jgi:hypothetical protein